MSKAISMTTQTEAPTICALCQQERPLVISHIIPKFVIRAFKRETITGYLRNAINPNVRYQDGPKEKLLCAECDNVRFSDAESAFAERVFNSHRAGTLKEFTCAESDRFFAASLAWRNIISNLRAGEEVLRTDGQGDQDIAAIRNAELALRSYLLGNAPYPNQYPQHLFFTDLTVGDAPTGLDVYLNAVLDMYLPGRDEYLYAVSNLSFGMLFVCPLRSDGDREREWREGGTLLEPGGVIRTSNQSIQDGYFGGLLALRPEQLQPYKTASTAQKDKIAKDIAKADIGRWLEGRHGAAYQRELEKAADVREFALVAWRNGQPERTAIPYEALRELLADPMPDVLSRVDALEVGKGVMVVTNEERVTVVRLA
jgi:hypothetical protein